MGKPHKHACVAQTCHGRWSNPPLLEGEDLASDLLPDGELEAIRLKLCVMEQAQGLEEPGTRGPGRGEGTGARAGQAAPEPWVPHGEGAIGPQISLRPRSWRPTSIPGRGPLGHYAV